MIDTVSQGKRPTVGLFVTCLVDSFRPSVGMATVDLLEAAGCTVVVPEAQTCCGQPGFNSGEQETARAMARMLIDSFADVDYIVVPSGSCAGMIKLHYPGLFEPQSDERAACEALAARCYELSVFLLEVLDADIASSSLAATYTYHDSCSGLRELDIKQQPRQLLSKVASLNASEMEDSEVCCGFGGTFCVKYPDISTRMVDDKIDSIAAAQADVVLGGDLGCLLNIAGRLKRLGRDEKVYHFAEVLAGYTDVAPIGEAEKGAK
jgi:L-lactate dehydrogenase complex protein LldE